MANNAPEDPYINFAVDGDNYTSSADLGILDNNVVAIDNLKDITEATENSALTHKHIINSEGASSLHTLVNTVLSMILLAHLTNQSLQIRFLLLLEKKAK